MQRWLLPVLRRLQPVSSRSGWVPLGAFGWGSVRLDETGLFVFAAGASLENVGLVIGTYGIVWLVWLVVNRIVCDHMDMMVRRFILGL